MRLILKVVASGILLFTPIYAQVNPVKLGSASNIWTAAYPDRNQVVVDQATNTIMFLHRQDITVHGGTTADNGLLRYDVSHDGGMTFSSNHGTINPLYQRRARYPQVTVYNPPGNTDPDNLRYLWTASTLSNVSGWQGFAYGMYSSDTSAGVLQERYYDHPGTPDVSQQGLTAGKPGEFWSAARDPNTSEVIVFKWVMDSGNDSANMVVDTVMSFNHRVSSVGIPLTAVNMAFSPSGDTGWVAFLGDLVGGQDDDTFTPVLIPSFDGGKTWGQAIEVDLLQMNYISQTGNDLHNDLLGYTCTTDPETGNPVNGATGVPSIPFEFDITVDKNGHPHFFTQIFNDWVNPFTVTSFATMLMVDITTNDGGLNWTGTRLASNQSWRFDINSGPGLPLFTYENYLQVSRSLDGSRIFYSWMDTDTAKTAPCNPRNRFPNLKIASLRISDRYITCVKNITENDPSWDGKVFFPTMAPVVLENSNGTDYHLPIVVAQSDTAANPESDPVDFYYFGNDAVISESDYKEYAGFLNADKCEITIGQAEQKESSINIFPNPTDGVIYIETTEIISNLNVIDASGKVIYNERNVSGRHQIRLDPGVYVVLFQEGMEYFTERIVVR